MIFYDVPFDGHTLVDIFSVVFAVAGSYLASVRNLERRITALEKAVAILLDRDRRGRIDDIPYQGKEDI